MLVMSADGGRQYAQILRRIWADSEWKTLTGEQQHLYLLVLSQSAVNYAGVLPLTIRRWSNLFEDGNRHSIEEALEVLAERRFIVVDWDTEEVLVRTFIRNDGIWKQPRMMAMALRQSSQIESHTLRNALAEELRRLVLEMSDQNLAAQTAKQANTLAGGPDSPPDPPHGATHPEGMTSSSVSSFSLPESPTSETRNKKQETNLAALGSRAPARRRDPYPIPHDWKPDELHGSKARQLNADLNFETDQFRNHALANGRLAVDWSAAFHNWLGHAKPRRAQGQSTADQRVAQARAVGERFSDNNIESIFKEIEP